MTRRHVGIADRLEQRGREPWNISMRVNMKRARPRNVSRTLYNYTGRGLPSRATPDTPPLAAAMLPTANVKQRGAGDAVTVGMVAHGVAWETMAWNTGVGHGKRQRGVGRRSDGDADGL